MKTIRIDQDLKAVCSDCDNAVNGPAPGYCKDCLLYGIYKATVEGFGFKVNEK